MPPAEVWGSHGTAGASALSPDADSDTSASLELLTRAMQEVLEDDDLRARLAGRARRRAVEAFSLDDIVSQLEEIYAEAIARCPRPRRSTPP